MLKVIRNKKELKEAIGILRSLNKTIGFVPTMGALHTGHMSLINTALHHTDFAVTSVFVNPTQFGPNEDFSKYPRTEAEDIKKLDEAGVAIAYLPTVEEMYPQGAITKVKVPEISEELCGAYRPGHFDGVATIVTKLFMQVMPDIAIFGEKDYQQLHIIKQIVRDLDIPVQVISSPTLRESSGLAMSSRNRYLDEGEKKIASLLYKILQETRDKLRSGYDIEKAITEAKESLLAAGFKKIDYVELRDAESLGKIRSASNSSRLLAAAYLGTTRLIDNIPV